MPDTLTPPSNQSSTPTVVRRRVYLVDDHPIVRQGLAALIDQEPDLTVCGQAAGPTAALAEIEASRAEIAIVDLSLGEGSGVDLTRKLTALGVPVLVLSMHDEKLHAGRVLKAGARGYVMKQEASSRVLTAIRRVLAGDVYVSADVASRLLTGGEAPSGVERLSDREYQVLTMIGNGMGPKDMAEAMGVSVKTVETHRENLKGKLGLKDRNELTRFALQHALDTGKA